MNGDLEIRRFEVGDDGENLNVTIEIHNHSARTLHVYREVRGVRYDENTNTVKLLLTDRHFDHSFPTFVTPQPALVPVNPGESEILKLRVPRVITQIGPERTGQPGPTLRESHIHQSESAEAEISWSDTPYYREPGERRNKVEQLRRWERGALHVRLNRRTGELTRPAGS